MHKGREVVRVQLAVMIPIRTSKLRFHPMLFSVMLWAVAHLIATGPYFVQVT
jgi:uncharacterized membrane protein